MSLKTRKILYLIFVLIFLIAAPAISLYAAGYTLSSGFKITKTGILIVDTKPSDATISLDNTVKQKLLNKLIFNEEKFITSPAKIKNIPPGEYDIKLSKEGYWDWDKKLSIKPGESTYVEDVSLFKKDIPLSVVEGEFTSLKISPNKEYIAAFSEKNAILINLANDETKYLEFETKIKNDLIATSSMISWSPDSKKLINGNYIFDVKNWSNPFDIKKEIGENIKNLKWSGSANIYYVSSDALNEFSLSSKINEKIAYTKKIEDYLPNDNFIFILDGGSSVKKIDIYNLREKEISGTINLPFSNYLFSDFQTKYLNVYDQTHKILYIIDPFSSYRQLKETVNNASFFEWINNEKLLYANSHEVWIFDMNARKNTLLTRISQDIKKTIWHPSNNYVVYATSQDIFTIELDDREKYNIVKLLSLNQIKNPMLNKKGDALYFYSKIGSQSGIYKLSIQ